MSTYSYRLTGTLISLVTSGAAVTSFRGRLPSPAKTISLSASYLPGALSNIPLDNLLPNYFANKRNIVNVLLVKKAWGWTTLAWGVHWVYGIIAAQKQQQAGGRNVGMSTLDKRRYIYRPVKRYLTATILWLLFTTWFFGPSLSDRLLVLSGAQCVPSSMSSTHAAGSAASPETAQTANEPNHAILDHTHCLSRSPMARASDDISSNSELAKGASSASGSKHSQHNRAYWKGGHDISGHSFLLTHSSLFLMTEIAPTLSVLLETATGQPSGAQTRQGRLTPTMSAARSRIESTLGRRYAALGVTVLVSIWWWMLLMTSLYFHTPQEKVSGFAAGVLGWWSSYVLAG